ncbi:MAG: hypothetical protein HY517_01100, partial [Candidatus Aenigmarchaeota archaeon]|nr:hypothetical protein [Candidatus Aenigmarchaeota archaeon]
MVQPDQDASSAPSPQTKPGSAMEQLRSARDTLYEEMKKDPTTEIPWAVHELLVKLNSTLDGRTPAEQKPANGMEKAVRTGKGTAQKLISFLLKKPNKPLDYQDVYKAFPDEDPNYIRNALSRMKRGEVRLPGDGGIVYKASGGRGVIIIEKFDKNVKTPPGRKPRKAAYRALVFLYHNPNADEDALIGYTEAETNKLNRVLGFLRGAGYLEKDSNRLTESGRIKVEKPAGRGRMLGEPLMPRMREYLAGKAGSEVGLDEVIGEFGNYRRDTVEQYFSWFGAGAQTVPGFEIAKSGENKIRVEKIAAPAPQDDAPDMGGANGSQQDRRNGGKAYAAAVSSIGEVYQEFPALPDLIGGRLGLEP